jgi:hypothetical protein
MFGINGLKVDVDVLESIVINNRVSSNDYNDFKRIVLERLDLHRSNIDRISDKIDNLYAYFNVCEVINKKRTVMPIDSKQDSCNCK